MNALKLMTIRWVLVLGVAVLVGVMANVSLADPPRHGGYGGSDSQPGYINRDGGGNGQFCPLPPGFRPPMNHGGYGWYGGYSGGCIRTDGFGGYPNGGCIRTGGFGGTSGTTIIIIIR